MNCFWPRGLPNGHVHFRERGRLSWDWEEQWGMGARSSSAGTAAATVFYAYNVRNNETYFSAFIEHLYPKWETNNVSSRSEMKTSSVWYPLGPWLSSDKAIAFLLDTKARKRILALNLLCSATFPTTLPPQKWGEKKYQRSISLAYEERNSIQMTFALQSNKLGSICLTVRYS